MILALALGAPAHATPALPALGAHDPIGEHGRQRDLFGAQAPPDLWPAPGVYGGPPTAGPTSRVYGYMAYWDDDLAQVPWDDLTEIAVFSAHVDTAGNLSDTGNWSQAAAAVAMGAPYDVRIHLCVTNFTSSQLDTLLGSSTARANLISQLETWVSSTGAHGVNIDFENLPVSRKDEMVTFAAELDAAFEDVVLAVPAVDWNGSWDFDQLTLYADLFIMGYDYHWSGSTQAGPSDPLYGGPGTVWADDHALDWTVDDYLFYGANPDRVILGLPLYGRAWYTASDAVPSAATGDAGTVLWASAQSDLAIYTGSLETGARGIHYYDGSAQHWVNDVDTMRERVQFALGEGLAGVGFWALNYDDEDADLWTMVRQETGGGSITPPPDTGVDTGDPGDTDTPDPEPDTDVPDPDPDPDPDPEPEPDPDPLPEVPVDAAFVAVGGAPLLAYVGDTVVLTAQGSTGPAGVALQYAWTQRTGTPAGLQDANTMTPSFVVPAAGTYVFAVRVGDGAVASPAVESHVVVLDPSAAAIVGEPRGCGCDGVGAGAGFGLLGALGMFVRRRRTSALT